MINWIGNYFLCMVISLLLAGLIIPKIMEIAFSKKLFDEVDERKIHRGVVPRLGGVSFLPSLLFSFCVVIGYTIGTGYYGYEITLNSIVPIFFLFCSLMLMYLVGIADDMIGVRYRAKFLFQIVAGTLIVMSGLFIKTLWGFLWIESWPAWIGWIATVFLAIYVINAINLIDGIDGLASGLSLIALIFYSFVLLKCGEYLYAMLAGATIGTIVPFFYFNVFGKADRHTKIFMGDTGSLTIGTLLTFLAVAIFNIDPVESEGHNLGVVAMAPIILPCFDVARVFLHRIRRGKNPFLPDKCHIHHKFLALGMPQWEALILILIIDSIFIAVNMILSTYVDPTWIILGDIVVWTLFNLLLTKLIRNREQKLEVKLYE